MEDLDYECDEEVRRYRERKRGFAGDDTKRTASEGFSDEASPKKGMKPARLPKHLQKDMHVKMESGLEKAPFLMQFKG